MKKYSCLVILLSLFTIGCDSTEGPTGDNNTDTLQIMPLKVGNSWTYARDFFGEDQLILSDSFTFSLTKESIIGGETYFRIDTSNSYYLNRTNGLWHFGSRGLAHYAKYPCAVGDTFGSDSIFFNHRDTSGNIDRIDTSIAVPKVAAKDLVLSVNGNLYTTIQYASDYYLKNSSFLFARLIEYYAVNVGLVRSEFIYFDENAKIWNFDNAIQNLLKAEIK